jgi:hypothetical protein
LISIKNNVLSLSKSFDVPGLHDAFDCNLFEGLETQHKQEMVQCKTLAFTGVGPLLVLIPFVDQLTCFVVNA